MGVTINEIVTPEKVGFLAELTDWSTWDYVATYLDCKIYRKWMDAWSAYYWGSPCITGYFWTRKAVKKRICTGQGGTWDGSSCSFEPEPEPGWEHDSFYRGIEILVWMPDGTPYMAYYDGVWHTAASLSTIQAGIDDFLGVGIPTTLTLSAPDRAEVEEKFNIYGLLLETKSADPIPFHSINHSYNGKSLGMSTTGVEGDYLKEVSIPESGVWTIKSEFLGTSAYAASRLVADTIVAASPLEVAIKIAGSAAVGLALTMYGLS